MAVEHLIRLGHRRIATITGRLDMTAGQDRLEGYRQALQAHYIPLEEALVVEGDFTEDSGMKAMQRLLPVSPSAVFAASDAMAIGALKSTEVAPAPSAFASRAAHPVFAGTTMRRIAPPT